jgi:hypothetical protein
MKLIRKKPLRIAGILLFFTLALLIYLLGWSNFFKISSVTIKTTDSANKSLILDQLSLMNQPLKVGDPLARINARAITLNLQRETWIGKIQLERNWFDGSVQLFVNERIPFFQIENREKVEEGVLYQPQFLDQSGAIFTLPGNLAQKYQKLPEISLSPSALGDRSEIFSFYVAINQKFPTSKITLTALSEFESKNLVERYESRDDREGTATGENEREKTSIKIFWGENRDISLKIAVIERLLSLKSSRRIVEIDVKNPALPIVRNFEAR